MFDCHFIINELQRHSAAAAFKDRQTLNEG
jgi:hypothetical protein